jgi:hypothetical protein
MSNIIGQTFEDYVGEQIKKRQEIYGSGTPGNTRSIEEISYLNSRTSWLKFASGTSMDSKRLSLLKKNGNELVGDEEGLALAKNNVLFGGLSSLQGDSLVGRSGITGENKAYGVGGTAFGFSPIPGIVDASIVCLNNGSLRKATINIKAHNKNQFDIIDALYMRLGYTVLLEWGNDKYFTNPPNSFLTPMGPTLIESQFFDEGNNETSYDYWLPAIEKLRRETSGNYDALFGIVSNFSWTFETDGTYTIKVMLYTMGDVMESFKMKVPVPSKISTKEFSDSPQGENFETNPTLDSEGFEKNYVNTDGSVEEGKANAAGYFGFLITEFADEILDQDLTLPGRLSQYKERTNGGSIFNLQIYPKIPKQVDKNNKMWFYILAAEELWNLQYHPESKIGEGATRQITKEGKKTLQTYTQALESLTKEENLKKIETQKTIEIQVEKLQESKIHYLFFQIKKIAAEHTKEKSLLIHYLISNTYNIIERIIMGEILNKDEDIRKNLKGLGLNTSDTTDVISTEISYPTATDKVQKAYYIRFGTFLDFIQNQIFMKIIGKNDFTSYLQIDTEAKNNIMYTIPNQLSTDPTICIIKNPSFELAGGEKIKYWEGLEDFIGEVGEGIAYGKIMNIYLNLDYIENILDSSNKVSVFSFLNTICNDLNSSLGQVNNLQPVINSEANKITIIDQTPIQGKDKIIEKLGGKTTPDQTPTLEVYGYNPNNNTSNFVKSIGLTTEISKEYSTMITLGATVGGYIPGEEATAFSRWNVGIEDRFKKYLGDGSSNDPNPIENFEKENQGVKNSYVKYLSQGMNRIVGLNPKDKGSPYTTNPNTISTNTEAVGHFNKYLQASASLSTETAESSVGFIPFNLHLTLDGLSGIKIYNKVEITQGFLPSNYPETLEFVVTQVDHKLLDNTWETELGTIGTSKTRPEGSVISNKSFLSTAERIKTEVESTISTNGEQANLLRATLSLYGYTEKGVEIDNGGDITIGIRKAAEAIFKDLNRVKPKMKIEVTGGNDIFHQRLKNSNSRHKAGNGLDFVITPSTNKNLDDVVLLLQRYAAGNDGNFRFIDEYRHKTEDGTGDHFHISWGKGTEGKLELEGALLLARAGEIAPIKIV